MDQGEPVDIIYFYFAKVFKKLPYSDMATSQRLLKKLEAHGIAGDVLKWTKDWLVGRRQKVSVNKKYSDWQDVLSGVPQGSVLGPLLFVIYINDIDINTVSKLCKFADDTKLCKGIVDDTDAAILREDLNKIYQWSLDWQMLFNTDKCTVVHIGKK